MSAKVDTQLENGTLLTDARSPGSCEQNRDSAFRVVFFWIYGTFLFEFGALQATGELLAQSLVGLISLFFGAAVCLRYRRFRLSAARLYGEGRVSVQRPASALTVWLVLMFILGLFVGYLLVRGNPALLVPAVGVLTFISWSRGCRRNREFYCTGVVVAVGTAIPLMLTEGSLGNPFIMLIAGWAFWFSAAVAFLHWR